MPGPLRKQAWKLYLTDPQSRKEYESKVKTRKSSTESAIDSQITRNCENLIDKDFPELGNERKILLSLKTVLSYHHVLENKPEEAGDPLYYLAIPIVYVYGSEYNGLAQCIEAFLALLDAPRPRFSEQGRRSDTNRCVSRVSGLLKEKDRDFYDKLCSIFVNEAGSESEDWSIARLVQPAIERLFVGVTQLEVTLYIWDQLLMVPLLPFAILSFIHFLLPSPPISSLFFLC